MSVNSSAELADLMHSADVARLALLASFDPERLNASRFRLICDELASRQGRPQWGLRETARVDALAYAMATGGREALQELRVGVADAVEESALQTMLDAAVDDRVRPVDQLTENELMTGLTVARWLLTACSLAGRTDLIPSGLDRDRMESRLARLQTLQPILAITADGCVGRDRERSIVAGFVDRAEVERSLADLPALQIYGIGGVGKSTLVAQVLRDLDERPDPVRPLWAYLDLDRPTLSSYDPEVILADVIKQVSAQQPVARRDLLGIADQLAQVSFGHGIEASGQIWWYAAEQLARVLSSIGNRLVVVLDTFEELQRSSDRAGDLVFEMFHRLSVGLPSFRLIVSGRAPAQVFLEARDDSPQLLQVKEFDLATASDVLAHLHRAELGRRRQKGRRVPDLPLDQGLIDQVTGLVGGSPLTLRLAARVLVDEGVAGIAGATQRARALSQVRVEFVRGFLYNRILDHLGGAGRSPDSPLADIARASLVLRVITPQLLDAVVFPVIGRVTPDGARWFEELRRESGLAFTGTNGLHVRDELRGPALLALSYDDTNDLVRRMHEAAASYYRLHRAEPGAEAELLYHLLALGREPETLVADGLVTPSALLAALESERTADLSEAFLAVAPRGGTGSELQAALERRTRERQLADRVTRALAAGSPAEASSILAEDPGPWSPGTLLHRLDADVQDQLGNLEASVQAARLEVSAALIAGGAERYAAAAIRCALLQERNGAGIAGTTTLIEASTAALLAGRPALILQIHLNLMTLTERIETADDGWLLELDARSLLGRLTGDERDDPALVRLLAATLGRRESSWIRTAVETLGLGFAPRADHLRALAEALADWDETQAQPGRLSKLVGISRVGSTPDDRRLAWTQALTGPDAGNLLNRVLSVGSPPGPVLEAVRRIYLWWDIVTGSAQAQASAPPAGAAEPTEHFLDGQLDFTDNALQTLLTTLTKAYPTTTDMQVVASQSGLDVRSLNLRERPQSVWRQVLFEASSHGMLPELVQTVLGDQTTEFLHEQVAEAIGADWLESHDIPKSS